MIVWVWFVYLCCLPVVESRSTRLKLWKISADQPQAPCLTTLCAGEAVIENNWVDEHWLKLLKLKAHLFRRK